ncbi:MAG TPA: hypothetical protein VH143_32415 [Kofleriaceae bacterium]|jgi:hypothetical protein|nr:hypothetical protein [Kofleriaceae bacterium]
MTRAWSLFFVALLACGGSNPQPATTPLPEPAAPPDAAPAAPPPAPPEAAKPLDLPIPAPQTSLKLIKPGAGKKAVLKLAIAAAKQHVELALDFSGKQVAPASLGGNSEDVAPTLVLAADTEIGDVGSDGNATWKLTVASVDARDRAGSKTPTDKFKDQMQGIVGLVISGSIGADGKLGNMAIHLDKAEKSALNAVALVKLSLMPMWPQLPTDAIGVGAKWTVTNPFKIADKLDTTQTADYELVSHKGNQWVINAKIKLAGNDLKADEHTSFQKIAGTGAVAVTLTDGAAVPQLTSTLASDFTAVLQTGSGSADLQQAQFHLEQGFAVTPK